MKSACLFTSGMLCVASEAKEAAINRDLFVQVVLFVFSHSVLCHNKKIIIKIFKSTCEGLEKFYLKKQLIQVEATAGSYFIISVFSVVPCSQWQEPTHIHICYSTNVYLHSQPYTQGCHSGGKSGTDYPEPQRGSHLMRQAEMKCLFSPHLFSLLLDEMAIVVITTNYLAPRCCLALC